MSNQIDLTRFEFLLSLDNNIICQRFFNVKDHKHGLKNSLDIYEYMSEVSSEISDELKRENFLYMTSKYFKDEYDEDFGGGNDYRLELKIENRTFFVRTFSAKVFHPKVRYSVDIRPQLKRYLSDLTNLLSTSVVKKQFQKYQLV